MMTIVLILSSLFTFTFGQTCPSGSLWDYGALGADVWPFIFPQCAGQLQSPINIITTDARFSPRLRPFEIINDNKEIQFNISNNGITIVMTPLPTKTPIMLEGSILTRDYTLANIVFRWGENNLQGSEHQINGRKFPLEMQMLFVSDDGQQVILSFLFTISALDNLALTSILEAVIVARDEIGSSLIKLRLNTILPQSLASYYQYIGSLTQPPCTEGILVNVFPILIPISSNQMSIFRITNIALNFRPVQELNGRVVETSILD